MFERLHKVRFGEVDYAGIMYYPRYFEALNATVEDWFSDVAHSGFEHLSDRFKVTTPLISIETEFSRVCRLGDELIFRLTVTKVGASSARFRADTFCGDEARMRSMLTHVCIDRTIGKAVPWPDEVKTRLLQIASEDA